MKLELLGGIDFLEVKAPGPFTDVIYDAISSVKNTGAKQQGYELMVDLEPYGLPAMLHYGSRWTQQHKLQVKAVGEKGFTEIIDIIGSVFDGDPSEAVIMRLDAKVDTDYPVQYFKEHARIPYKRNKGEFSCLKHKESNLKSVETLEIGKRPNLSRFYDKLAEQRHDYRVYCNRMKKYGKEPEAFESRYGHPESGPILTRVERQFGGGRVPELVGTIGKLIANAEQFNPFEGIEFLKAVKMAAISESVSLRQRIVGEFLHEKNQEWGRQILESWVRKHAGSNATRFLKAFNGYMSVSPLEPPDLNGLFHKEFMKQVKA
jgi:hypothetical protein